MTIRRVFNFTTDPGTPTEQFGRALWNALAPVHGEPPVWAPGDPNGPTLDLASSDVVAHLLPHANLEIQPITGDVVRYTPGLATPPTSLASIHQQYYTIGMETRRTSSSEPNSPVPEQKCLDAVLNARPNPNPWVLVCRTHFNYMYQQEEMTIGIGPRPCHICGKPLEQGPDAVIIRQASVEPRVTPDFNLKAPTT